MSLASSFKVFPVLSSERLTLSEIDLREAEDFHRLQRSALDLPNRAPWEYGFETQSVETARSSLGFCQNAWKKKSRLRFGLRLEDKGIEAVAGQPRVSTLIGCCELFGIENQYKAELGFWLGAAYQGRGYMSEAVGAVVQYAFGSMGMGRLYAQTSPRNIASLRMLRKIGFVQEGILRQSTRRGGNWDDSVIMAILASDAKPSSRVAQNQRGTHLGREDVNPVFRKWSHNSFGGRPNVCQ